MEKQNAASQSIAAQNSELPVIYRIFLAEEVRCFEIYYTDPQITSKESVFYQTYQTAPDFVPPSSVVLTFNDKWPNLILHAFGFSIGPFCVSQELRSVIDLNFSGEVEFRSINVEANAPMRPNLFFQIRVPKDIQRIESKQVYPPFRAGDVAGVDIWRSGGGSLYCAERFRRVILDSGVSAGWQFSRYEVVA